MSLRQLNVIIGAGLLSFLIACAPTANPKVSQSDLKWTVENPNAMRSASEKVSKTAARETASESSLDALRSGQSTATSGPLKDVYFGFDRYDLSAEARATLKANAEWLKANPAVRAQIEGHCDERGTQEYNMALGAKRAQAALDYLATMGIAGNRLSTISYGEEVPACKDATESCWEKNRRARFIIQSGRPTS
jgi:peptidoglycan-associated lipoprotein